MLIFSLQTLRAAPITGSRPPFSVLKHSFHLLHAICIIVKISKRSVRGSGVRFSRGCRFFDWNIITAHHRVSLSLPLFPCSGGRLAREMFYIPQNACGRNCSLDTGLVPKWIFAARPPRIPQPWRETQKCSVESADWSGLAKEFFPPFTTSHKQYFFFIFLTRQRRFRALSLVQLAHCCLECKLEAVSRNRPATQSKSEKKEKKINLQHLISCGSPFLRPGPLSGWICVFLWALVVNWNTKKRSDSKETLCISSASVVDARTRTGATDTEHSTVCALTSPPLDFTMQICPRRPRELSSSLLPTEENPKQTNANRQSSRHDQSKIVENTKLAVDVSCWKIGSFKGPVCQNCSDVSAQPGEEDEGYIFA